MRQSETNQLGAIGEQAVSLALTKLGWGVVKSPTEFDVGTDLLIMVNDRGLFSLGVVLGAQVKTGQSFFSRPERDGAGEVVGWWFTDKDDEHSEYWLTHSLPHLLVLHDERTERSYWVMLTRKTVVPTGKGRKVLVPAVNLLDGEHLDELIEIALAGKPRPNWEGSAWTAADRVPQADMVRHALLVPRLVAPSPHSPREQEISAAQVLAMLVEARLDDIDDQIGRFQKLPSPRTWASSPDWYWRFAGAFHQRVTTSAVDPMLALLDSAPNASARSAVLAVSAAAMLDAAQAKRALDLLTDEVDSDADTVDHAWLLVQYTRACIEVGRIGDARRAAARAVSDRKWASTDVTASAIAGTAEELLFRVSDWRSADFTRVLAGQDTMAVWWRHQRLADGAADVITQQFTAWTRQQATVLFRDDIATMRLFTASILASHLGDHAAGARFAALNAAQRLLRCDRHAAAQDVAHLLTDLRLSGAEKELRQAVARVLDDGPAEAVTIAADAVDFGNWTRTTCDATLTLLQRGGDVLTTATATRAVAWLLDTLDDPTTFLTRTTPRFHVLPRLVETLAGVIPAATSDDHERVADLVLAIPPQRNHVPSDAWRSVVKALPTTVWTPERAARARAAAPGHHAQLRLALLGVAARVNEQAQHDLRRTLSQDGAAGVNALGPGWQNLTDDEVTALRDQAVETIQRQVVDAKATAHSIYDHDPADVLVLLNLFYPHLARWEPVYELLAEPMVAGADKVGSLQRLANHANQLHPHVRGRVLQIARENLVGPPSPLDDYPLSQDPHGATVRLIATLSRESEETASGLMTLLAGDDTDRAHAVAVAQLLPRPAAVGALAALTSDPRPHVRALTASALLRLTLTEPADTLALHALTAAAHDPGTRVARRISLSLKNMPDIPTELKHVVSSLRGHISATVRHHLPDVPDRTSP
ncbi:DUF4365 domain-containing protein [Actinokineospora sp. 24-640]